MVEMTSNLSSRLLFWLSIWNICCSSWFFLLCVSNDSNKLEQWAPTLLIFAEFLQNMHKTANINRALSSSSIHHLRSGFLVSLILLQVKYWFIRINPFIHMHKYLPKKYGLSIVWWSANVDTLTTHRCRACIQREGRQTKIESESKSNSEREQKRNRKMLLDNLPHRMFRSL